jgi:hypothetical protein
VTSRPCDQKRGSGSRTRTAERPLTEERVRSTGLRVHNTF